MSREIEKTDAVALRVYPYSNTSQIVAWLSERFGRLNTLHKGAYRTRSAFQGQCDAFQTCELVFYRRAGSEVQVAKECSPLCPRPGFHDDWRAAAVASCLCDLVLRVTETGPCDEQLFVLLNDALDRLHTGAPPGEVLPWFELRALNVLGLAPALASCVACGSDPAADAGGSVVSARRGGTLCGRCARTQSDETDRRVGGESLIVLRKWQEGGGFRRPGALGCGDERVPEIRAAVGDFVAYHLAVAPRARQIALELIGMERPNAL
jgi:DNA repair protein RecO (recombination protein O)